MATIDERPAGALLDSLGDRYARAGLDSAQFARRYWGLTSHGDLKARDLDELVAITLAHRRMGRRRQRGEALVRVYNPARDRDGWESPHTAVDIVVDEMPFVVDSVLAAFALHKRAVHVVVSPAMPVARDDHGDVVAGSDGPHAESWIHAEIDRMTDDSDVAVIESALAGVLEAVRSCASDFPEMVARTTAVGVAQPDSEHRALLQWLIDGHFVFLGMVDQDHVLGTLRNRTDQESALMPLVDDAFATGLPFLFTTTPVVSRVLRNAPMVLVAGTTPAGNGVGPHRWALVGLLTNSAYRERAIDVPIVRRLINDVLIGSGYPAASHEANALLAVLEDHPRDELFQIDVDALRDHALTVMRARTSIDAHVHVRRDILGRFVSCLVYVPTEHFHTALRVGIVRLLVVSLGGTHASFATTISSHGGARLHVMVYGEFPEELPVDIATLERQVSVMSRGWIDDLRVGLCDRHGEGVGLDLFRKWRDAFDAGYRDVWSGQGAVDDIGRLESLGADDLLVRVAKSPGDPAEQIRLCVYRSGSQIALSDFLPLLNDLGLTVVQQQPFLCRPLGGPQCWIYEFTVSSANAPGPETDSSRRLEAALVAVWKHRCESDLLGALVLGAELDWRDVALIRALRQYIRQTGAMYSREYYATTLRAHPGLTRLLVEAFHALFDPRTANADLADELLREFDDGVDEVESLDEDRILRRFSSVVRAVVRTNYFQRDDSGDVRDRIVFKIDSAGLDDLPEPRPMFELFVYAPHTEGVHLRMGLTSRGGLRASDRREDYRTEVLGLMKAQNVKNAVIVPLGAKGGFVVRNPVPHDRQRAQAEVIRCYRTFVEGMLDVTDNLVDGRVVPPLDVVRRDGDDCYLVVAADKGTATFSDLANEIALRRTFWLGDAFASGGSVGYDHKQMGITARGAWESVRRHFRQLGIDADTDPIRAVGVGDMSGDVFGNGMLLSPALSLVAAFDHRHVFVDPHPDPLASWTERKRLFSMPTSSWADYDAAVISPGGGVFSRSAKSVPITDQMRSALGTDAVSLTPDELIRVVLKAPVDLFWNGGIGTYVKATTENHAAASDRVNDAVRVDAGALRCRVVGEGGNLGVTQAGRVEFAKAGGLINTDAIDNSAGVDCSDHEVNIKIALSAAVANGKLAPSERGEFLASMTEEVAALVLANNYAQNVALTVIKNQAPELLDVHARHLTWLEAEAGLKRELEGLPSRSELNDRRLAGGGLNQPELAVLLAYAKNHMAAELAASDLARDQAFGPMLSRYFPTPMRQRFAEEIDAHPLRNELVSTLLTNHIINRAGISMAFRMNEETAATIPDVARAHVVAWQIYELNETWDDIAALDGRVGAASQIAAFLEVKKLGERATRWLLRNRRTPRDLDVSLEPLRNAVREMEGLFHEVLPTSVRAEIDATHRQLCDDGMPDVLARRSATMRIAVSALDIADLADPHRDTDTHRAELRWRAQVYFLVEERFGLGALRTGVTQLPRNDRWSALARAALRDDFFVVHRDIAAVVLASGTVSSPDSLVDQWFDERGSLVAGPRRLVNEISGAGTGSLAQLTVALRELRNIAQQSNRAMP